MRRGYVGRRESRGRRRANRLGCGRRHHLRLQTVHQARVLRVALVATPRVWIAVYSRVTGQFVGPRELLAATRVLAGMRLLSCVCPNVPSLVFQSVEGLVAEWTLVRSRELVVGFSSLSSRKRPVGPEHPYRSHVGVGPLWSGWIVRVRVRVQQIGKIHC